MQDFLTSPDMELFLRLFLAALAGWLIGLERETIGKTAGTRTMALVTLGAALFSIISSEGFLKATPGTFVVNTAIASGVVTGIGFIGAGLIIFRDGRVEGLTTAASLWMAAALGLGFGRGLYTISIFSFFLTLFLLYSMRWIHPERWKEQGGK